MNNQIKRVPIGKSLRFTVFERDQFTCQYCGATSADVKLHVDHIIPVSKGGTNDPENLRTSCASCNLGKSDKALGCEANPLDTLRRAQEAREMHDLAKEFKKANKIREEIRAMICEKLCCLTGQTYANKGNITSVFRAIQRFDSTMVLNWLDLSAQVVGRIHAPRELDIIKYFHGIIKHHDIENHTEVSHV